MGQLVKWDTLVLRALPLCVYPPIGLTFKPIIILDHKCKCSQCPTLPVITLLWYYNCNHLNMSGDYYKTLWEAWLPLTLNAAIKHLPKSPYNSDKFYVLANQIIRHLTAISPCQFIKLWWKVHQAMQKKNPPWSPDTDKTNRSHIRLGSFCSYQRAVEKNRLAHEPTSTIWQEMAGNYDINLILEKTSDGHIYEKGKLNKRGKITTHTHWGFRFLTTLWGFGFINLRHA